MFQGSYTYPWVSTVILGGIAVLGGFVTLALPETMGKMLPDTIDQAENLRRLESLESKPNDEDGVSNHNTRPEKPFQNGVINGRGFIPCPNHQYPTKFKAIHQEPNNWTENIQYPRNTDSHQSPKCAMYL